MINQQRQYLSVCRDRYRADLEDNVLPFWLKHCIDADGHMFFTVTAEGKIS